MEICSNCGEKIPQEEIKGDNYCYGDNTGKRVCENYLCDDCRNECPACENTFCKDCMEKIEGVWFCKNCIKYADDNYDEFEDENSD